MQILFAVFMTLNSLVLGTMLDHMFTLHYVDSDALQPDRTIVVGYEQYIRAKIRAKSWISMKNLEELFQN